MVRAVRLHSRTKLVLLACLIAACARSAPDLPPDYASVNARQELSLEDFNDKDAMATCEEIAAERNQIKANYVTLERQVTSTRRQDQTVGYLSAVLFPPAAILINQNKDAKKVLDEWQARLDELTALSTVKSCRQDTKASAEQTQ